MKMPGEFKNFRRLSLDGLFEELFENDAQCRTWIYIFSRIYCEWEDLQPLDTDPSAQKAYIYTLCIIYGVMPVPIQKIINKNHKDEIK